VRRKRKRRSGGRVRTRAGERTLGGAGEHARRRARTTRPWMASMARCAASRATKRTKPQPRAAPVSRLTRSVASRSCPKGAKRSRSPASVSCFGSWPTKSFASSAMGAAAARRTATAETLRDGRRERQSNY
jgi:hypothetical protein